MYCLHHFPKEKRTNECQDVLTGYALPRVIDEFAQLFTESGSDHDQNRCDRSQSIRRFPRQSWNSAQRPTTNIGGMFLADWTVLACWESLTFVTPGCDRALGSPPTLPQLGVSPRPQRPRGANPAAQET